MQAVSVPTISETKISELSETVRELVEASTKLAIKLAICECEKQNCPLIVIARQIAKAIDKLQSVSSQ